MTSSATHRLWHPPPPAFLQPLPLLSYSVALLSCSVALFFLESGLSLLQGRCCPQWALVGVDVERWPRPACRAVLPEMLSPASPSSLGGNCWWQGCPSGRRHQCPHVAWFQNWQGFRRPRGALRAQVPPESGAGLACGWDAVPECSRTVTMEQPQRRGPCCSCAGGMESAACPLHPSADSGLPAGPPGPAQMGRRGHPLTAWVPSNLEVPSTLQLPLHHPPGTPACLLTSGPRSLPQVLLMGWSLQEHRRVDPEGAPCWSSY